MGRARLTILRWMTATAIVGVNAGLIRAFLVQEMFAGAILIFFALQLGIWRALRTQGRMRRFWLGFVAAGIAVVFGLVAVELVPDSAGSRLTQRFLSLVFGLSQQHLPSSLDDLIMERQDEFLVIVYFVPEILVAILGGLILAGLGAKWQPVPNADEVP